MKLVKHGAACAVLCECDFKVADMLIDDLEAHRVRYENRIENGDLVILISPWTPRAEKIVKRAMELASL